MARAVEATPKIRSRSEGAAVALDDLDRRLLNLMQGSFPLAPRPYAEVALAAEVSETEVLARVKRLLADRIIRQVTPIYDTRALGYESMLVAAKVDAEHPWAPARIINSHPGVSHNYLRNHEFNMWFTIAVERDSRLGLDGTLDLLASLTGAESIRQLPTLKLFKIRMDLEMEGDTAALASAGAETAPAPLDAIAYDERDVAVIRATQGDLPVLSEPYAAAAAELGMSVAALLEHMQGMRERDCCVASQRSSFTGAPASRRTGWASGRCPIRRSSGSGREWLRFVASPTATSGRPTPTGRTRSSRWPTVARRRNATPCSTRSPPIRGSTTARRSTPRPSSRRSGCSTSPTPSASGRRSTPRGATPGEPTSAGEQGLSGGPRDAGSAALYARARRVLAGGVNSPVRAMRAVGRDPLFVARGAGAEIVDVDGNAYIDYVCSWGPLIAGHAHPAVLAAIAAASAAGTSFGAPTAAEVELAEEVVRRVPGVEMLRMASSGTEAAMSALRLARAATGRDRIIKFAGAYHGHSDGLLVAGGSGLMTQGIPASAGVPAAVVAATTVLPWNDVAALHEACAGDSPPAAIIAEPYPANMGLVPPAPGFLRTLREQASGCGALLVFDEVISGFRVASGGASERSGVTADLVVLGKVLGGGLPAAAVAGPRALLELLAPVGEVYQAGTLSGNPLAVAAGLATLGLLDPAAYEQLAETTEQLARGLRAAGAAHGVSVVSVPGLLTVFFSERAPSSFADVQQVDVGRYGAWWRGLLANGVYAPPSQYEAWFPSLAHTPALIERTVAAAAAAFAALGDQR